MSEQSNVFPKLHNAMWPGLVGKGDEEGQEPPISLDKMLDMTAKAEVNGVTFDGVDLFLFDPHTSIDITDDDLKALADKIGGMGFVIGSVVAPVWGPTGGGAAMGSEEDRGSFLGQVRKACSIAQKLKEMGARPYGIVRIDSASGVEDWEADPDGNTTRIVETFKQACDIAADHGERLAAEGEVCWGGMHTWRKMVDVFERVDRKETLGFQADMSHVLTFLLGRNAGGADRLLEGEFSGEQLDEAWATVSDALRPWTMDVHISQSDGTVHGSGSHDATGKHCRIDDANGKLDVVKHAGSWLQDAPSRGIQHICWDGCMFPNAVMTEQDTWNKILGGMIGVRDAHGWS